jgi:ABC-type nickel/cobalt efflux system permease component RcnA
MMCLLATIPAPTTEDSVTLTSAGAAIMTVSVLLVLGLCAFCFWRILREPTPSEHHHAPLDIDTRDENG